MGCLHSSPESTSDANKNANPIHKTEFLIEAKDVALFKFGGSAWEVFTSQPASTECAPSTVKVLTMNAWYDPLHQKRRAEALVDIVCSAKPDVASLQEITADAAEWILQDSRIRKLYATTDPGTVTRAASYGLMTLIKHTLYSHSRITATWQSFMPETMFGRGLLMVSLSDNDLAFGNLHLESPPKGLPEKRALQLNRSCKILSQAATTFVVMGDFNYVSDDENVNISECGGTDCWTQLRPADPGYTKDGEKNVHRQKRGEGVPNYQRMGRPDRVVCASDGCLQPLAIQLIGFELIDGIAVQASDHFGLLATLSPS
jgi:endonuclease/exonuclease/phosphatase family metal-dependent hydrolase